MGKRQRPRGLTGTKECVKCKKRHKLLTKEGECYICNPKQHGLEYFVTKIK